MTSKNPITCKVFRIRIEEEYLGAQKISCLAIHADGCASCSALLYEAEKDLAELFKDHHPLPDPGPLPYMSRRRQRRIKESVRQKVYRILKERRSEEGRSE